MRIISLMLLINLVMPLKEVYSQMPVKSSANSPPNQYELVKDTFLGGGPVTVDPARCYDTTSAELIFNVYETANNTTSSCLSWPRRSPWSHRTLYGRT
jgi:hypothetical protein